MKHVILGTVALGTLAGCGVGPAYEDTLKMRNSTDFVQQSIAGATCTRGEKPFTLIVAKDGTATGRLVPPKPAKGQKRERMPEFPAAMKTIDSDTVELVVGQGIVTQEAVAERMSAVLKDGEAVLRGDSFDCTDVLVRPIGA